MATTSVEDEEHNWMAFPRWSPWAWVMSKRSGVESSTSLGACGLSSHGSIKMFFFCEVSM